jgi:hypothetical protein
VRTVSEKSLGGLWAASFAGPKGFREPFYIFFFFSPLFLFLFSISFISFSNLVQIDSNQFVSFSKIQLNTVRQ